MKRAQTPPRDAVSLFRFAIDSRPDSNFVDIDGTFST
jgi:hypothetical protein